jgi:hypothetical protein
MTWRTDSILVITSLFQMLTTIQLNDGFFARSTKVHDIVSNGVLAAEGDSQLIIPYPHPEFLFCRRGYFSQVDGKVFGFGITSERAWHVCPLLASPICAPQNHAGQKWGKESCNLGINKDNLSILPSPPPNSMIAGIWGRTGGGQDGGHFTRSIFH